jgi:hypothetical protein
MLFHLAKANHADPCLDRLDAEVFETVLGGNAEEDLDAILQEADGTPLAESQTGSGAERAGDLGDSGEAQPGQSLR